MPDLYLVEFKGNRRELFYNNFYHSLKINDYVIVQAERGEDAGVLKSKVQKDMDFSDMERPRSILRPASDEDKNNITDNLADEDALWDNAVRLIKKHKLEMKLVDVEYQFDRNKLTFYFTADHRVDFRALVRDLASEYKTRIELRQIGVRDEAKRLGGLGVCGMQLCCASFLHNFDPVSTQDARVQGLSLNPSKISGNCGRLLCCLKYEVDYYADVRGKYPEVGAKYTTERGEGVVDKIDVFEDYMVIKHEFGEEEKITGNDLKKDNRKNSPFYRECLNQNNSFKKDNSFRREDKS
jgi:cell fate regulator YaaT (PSP1 superfamily)